MLKRGKILAYKKNDLDFIVCQVEIEAEKIIEDVIVCGADTLNWRPNLNKYYPIFVDRNNKGIILVGYQTLEVTDNQGLVYKAHMKDDGSVKDWIVQYWNEADEVKSGIWKNGNIGAGIGEIEPLRTLHTKNFRLDEPEGTGTHTEVTGTVLNTIGLNINGVTRYFLVSN